MNRLFLICPDCHMEERIRSHFSGNAHFLTALGTVLEPFELSEAEAMNQLVINTEISEICIVNTTANRFLCRTLEGGKSYGTKAEAVLQNLADTHADKLRGTTTENRRKLASLNIRKQAQVLLESPFIGEKIQSGAVQLKGYIFDSQDKKFEEVAFRQASMAM